jgi:hypothetical protein
MSKKQLALITYKGRSLGIVVLTAAQLLIGAIHALFGLLLLAGENLSFLPATAAYDVYTFIFGLLTLVFAVFIWQGKKTGWAGMIAVSLFVLAADSLTILNLPSIPGIPKFPAYTEIPYSILVIYYLSLRHVRRKFLK